VTARCRDRGEGGAATVLAVSCLTLLVFLGAALGVVAALVAAHRSAQGGADLAALAGAEVLGRGRDPCAAAVDVAARNRVEVLSCVVVVRAPGPHWLGQAADPTARARAGPAR
jgi:secretion/DNA translocation related TadE-like protein